MASKEPKPWPQRPLFRHLVDAWIARNKKTKRDLAEAAEIEPGSLKQYYSGSQIPGRDLALRLAGVLGCQISDLLGEPTSSADALPRDEAFAQIMGIYGPNIPDDIKKMLIGLAQAHQPKGVVLVEPEDMRVQEITASLGKSALVGNLSTEALEKKARAERQERKKVSEDGRVVKPTPQAAKKAQPHPLGKSTPVLKKKAKGAKR